MAGHRCVWMSWLRRGRGWDRHGPHLVCLQTQVPPAPQHTQPPEMPGTVYRKLEGAGVAGAPRAARGSMEATRLCPVEKGPGSGPSQLGTVCLDPVSLQEIKSALKRSVHLCRALHTRAGASMRLGARVLAGAGVALLQTQLWGRLGSPWDHQDSLSACDLCPQGALSAQACHLGDPPPGVCTNLVAVVHVQQEPRLPRLLEPPILVLLGPSEETDTSISECEGGTTGRALEAEAGQPLSEAKAESAEGSMVARVLVRQMCQLSRLWGPLANLGCPHCNRT